MIKPGRPFIRPSDMVTMADGRLAVRDNGGIQLFDDEGVFLGHVGQGRLGKCYGLSTDGKVRLELSQVKGMAEAVEISECSHPSSLKHCLWYFFFLLKGSLITLNQKFQRGAPTAHVEVMVINVETDKVTKEISLGSIITDMTKSKCRFLHHRENKLYVVDLGTEMLLLVFVLSRHECQSLTRLYFAGLDVVYVIDMIMLEVDTFGGTGTKNGLFLDPAGIVVDDQGYMIVADSRNHKLKAGLYFSSLYSPVKSPRVRLNPDLQVFSNHREYKGQVMTLDRPLKRPSGIVASLDSDSEPALYVLNLWGHNMVKYILQRK